MSASASPATAPAVPAGRAFEELAAQYDARFTNSLLGRVLRQAIWRRLDARFAPGSRILDLGCGTGEDAIYLARRGMQVVALDQAAAMVDAARNKARAAGLEHCIAVHHASIESLAEGHAADALAFDGALSNFGALNCCGADLTGIASGIARRLTPGAPLILVVMGRYVPWEWLWFLGRGQPRKAFRRLHADAAQWRGMTVRYPSMRVLQRAFAPAFRSVRVSGLGFLLPPSYAESWAVRHPRVIEALDRWERRIEAVPAVAWLADHYVLELERL